MLIISVGNRMKCGGICRSPTGCTMGAVSWNYENKFNLTAVGWDKYITSFRCYRDEPVDTE